MRYVLPKLGYNTWIGGHDQEKEGQWQWIKAVGETRERDEIQLLLWLPRQPSNNGDCLEAYDGSLNDEGFEIENPFVCEYNK